MTAVLTELPVSPYKGLANYTEDDAALSPVDLVVNAVAVGRGEQVFRR